jgi:CHAD domain-containing protein
MAKTAEEQRERELKFDIDDGWELPDPSRLVPDQGSVEREVVHLETTYYDTAAQNLLQHRLTLRRRSGDIDTGWQLKVPDGDARVEIRLPPGGRGIPEQLRRATLGVRAGAALKPVATLRTTREIHRLLDAEGTALAEIVLDAVTSTRMLEFTVTRHWREVEVELVAGDERLLDNASRWLLERGARRSAATSKLAETFEMEPSRPRDLMTLAGLVGAYLDQQLQAIVRGDVELRRGQDAIHATRVATRRYRSVLRVFGQVLDADRAAALDAELAWYAAALGEVRDRQVLRSRLDDMLAELPPELVLGPVAARIHQTLTAEQLQAEAELTTLMGTRRYFRLLAELRAWQEDLPVGDDHPAAAVDGFVRSAERKVRRRLKKAPEGAGRDEALHRARKAAKRARYAAELSRPALGEPSRARTKRLKKTQQELGTHHDRAVAADFLRRLGAAAGAAGENGFTFGLLYERERAGAGRPAD